MARLTSQRGDVFWGDLPESRSLYYETLEDVVSQLVWGLRKQQLLNLVMDWMKIVCTACEQEAIRLYYLRGLTYRQVASDMNVSYSTAWRDCNRAIKHLRDKARKEGYIK